MTPDPDDALTWDGDESDAPRRPSLPQGWNAVGKGSETVARQDDDGAVIDEAVAVAADDVQPAGIGNAALLGLGVIGGIYLLYSVGWLVAGLRLRDRAVFLVSDAMYVPWLILAIAAPALWFLATWLLTRSRPTWVRILALIAGIVLLVPWPFVTVGAIGA